MTGRRLVPVHVVTRCTLCLWIMMLQHCGPLSASINVLHSFIRQAENKKQSSTTFTFSFVCSPVSFSWISALNKLQLCLCEGWMDKNTITQTYNLYEVCYVLGKKLRIFFCAALSVKTVRTVLASRTEFYIWIVRREITCVQIFNRGWPRDIKNKRGKRLYLLLVLVQICAEIWVFSPVRRTWNSRTGKKRLPSLTYNRIE